MPTHSLYLTTNFPNIEQLINKYTTSIWLDTTTPTPDFVLSDSNVTSWLNKSKNGYNKLSNVGTITYNSTLPTSVSLPANTYFKQTASPYFNPTTSLQTWVFVISIPTAITGTNSITLINPVIPGGGYALQLRAGRFLIARVGYSEGIGFNIDLTPNTKYLFSISLNLTSTSYTYALANSIMRLNGTTPTGTITGPSTNYTLNFASTASLAINAVGLGGQFYPSDKQVNIYEMIGISNQALNLTDINTIENYLNTKWNLGYTIT